MPLFWPSRPARPKLNLDDSALVISWAPELGAEHYTVQVWDGLEERTFDWDTKCLLHADGGLALPGSQTEVFVHCVSSGMAYKGRIAAKRQGVWGSYSAYSAAVRAPVVQAPGRPRLVACGGANVRVEWPEVPGADSYSVVVHDGRAERHFDWVKGRLLTENEGSGQCVPGGQTHVSLVVAAGRTYKVKIITRQGCVWSAFSQYSAAFQLPPPLRPGSRTSEAEPAAGNSSASSPISSRSVASLASGLLFGEGAAKRIKAALGVLSLSMRGTSV